MSSVMSGVFRLGRTTVLGSLRRNGPGMNIVALQLPFGPRNEDYDDALT